MIRFVSLLIVCLPLAAASSAYVPSDSYIDRATTTKLAKVELRLYPGLTTDDYINVVIGNATFLLSYMDVSKPTIMYISGWNEDEASDSVLSIVSAYITRGGYNVLSVDWHKIADTVIYSYAALSVEGVGYTVAAGIDDLVEGGLNASTLHVIGHSLGAQVAGAIGRYVTNPLPRISGLDPAQPLFLLGMVNHLTSDNAEFVDIIHTDAGIAGIYYSAGDVDFWPNGGYSPQPGCLGLTIEPQTCSHRRSWQYYAESVLNETAYVGRQCSTYIAFQLGSCNSKNVEYMGFNVSTSVSGNYFLKVSSTSPYGLGETGSHS